MGAGMAVFGAVTSVMAAKQANKHAERSMRSATENAKRRYAHLNKIKKSKTKMAHAARDVQALKMRSKAARAAGKVKVAQAEGGMSTVGGGSGEALMTQVGIDEQFNQQMISTNTGNVLERISSEYDAGNIETQGTYEAQIAQAMSQTQDPFLAGLTGGVQGLGTGLQIKNAMA